VLWDLYTKGCESFFPQAFLPVKDVTIPAILYEGELAGELSTMRRKCRGEGRKEKINKKEDL
jgi:hypothetical protein